VSAIIRPAFDAANGARAAAAFARWRLPMRLGAILGRTVLPGIILNG
jgi:hypothetical protein